ITPHLVVGDMDSLERTVIHESVQWEKFPQEKDYSDFEIALRRSRGMNPEVIMVYGAVGGGRKDHEITNIVLLAYADLPVQFIEEDVEVYNVPGRLEVAGRKGCTCSLVSFGTGSYIVDMSGFRYTMKEQVLKPSSRGLSNVITEDPAVILPGRGDLVMIINKEKVVNPHQI
ncbi:MAG: thiamine diphosphokinase, partial [Spirochaetota bacterium]